MLKRVGESRHPCLTPTVVWNQPPMLLSSTSEMSPAPARPQTCLHGLPEGLRRGLACSFVGNHQEVHHQVYEDMVEVLLLLEILLTEDS